MSRLSGAIELRLRGFDLSRGRAMSAFALNASVVNVRNWARSRHLNQRLSNMWHNAIYATSELFCPVSAHPFLGHGKAISWRQQDELEYRRKT